MKKSIFPLLRFASMVMIFLFLSCLKKEVVAPIIAVDTATVKLDEEQKQTYITDSSYKYEYRTGTTGDYEYNYDVSGTDYNGNAVSGNVTMNGKYGIGTITTDDGTEVDLDIEWTGKGTLTGTDTDGNIYDLETE